MPCIRPLVLYFSENIEWSRETCLRLTWIWLWNCEPLKQPLSVAFRRSLDDRLDQGVFEEEEETSSKLKACRVLTLGRTVGQITPVRRQWLHEILPTHLDLKQNGTGQSFFTVDCEHYLHWSTRKALCDNILTNESGNLSRFTSSRIFMLRAGERAPEQSKPDI